VSPSGRWIPGRRSRALFEVDRAVFHAVVVGENQHVSVPSQWGVVDGPHQVSVLGDRPKYFVTDIYYEASQSGPVAAGFANIPGQSGVRGSNSLGRPAPSFDGTSIRQAIDHSRMTRVDSIRTVGVVGAGTMGAGIAQVAATAGYEVTMVDVDLTWSTPASTASTTASTDWSARTNSRARRPMPHAIGSTGRQRPRTWPTPTWPSRPSSSR